MLNTAGQGYDDSSQQQERPNRSTKPGTAWPISEIYSQGFVLSDSLAALEARDD